MGKYLQSVLHPASTTGSYTYVAGMQFFLHGPSTSASSLPPLVLPHTFLLLFLLFLILLFLFVKGIGTDVDRSITLYS